MEVGEGSEKEAEVFGSRKKEVRGEEKWEELVATGKETYEEEEEEKDQKQEEDDNVITPSRVNSIIQLRRHCT